MQTMRLGRTGLVVSRTAFGALPIQRTPMDEAVRILRKAQESGITFYDTARGYSDSEEKLGRAFEGVRGQVVLATKSGAKTRDELLAHAETSLKMLRTDHVDLLQLHNPKALGDPSDAKSPLAGLMEARRKGMTRFIGGSFHDLKLAVQAAKSGVFDTVQFPLSLLSSEAELELAAACKAADVGLIAMKALSGGLITNVALAFAFLRQYDNVLPIWGIQRESELDDFVRLEANPPVLDQGMRDAIAAERKALSGAFCRGCGYCLPCTVGIPINMAARMSLLLRRSPYRNLLSEEWQKNMARIEECTECGQCREKCPYGLDTPALLKANLKDYREFLAAHPM
jgi:predicted aldo/keto reductase-like oxidoreductase